MLKAHSPSTHLVSGLALSLFVYAGQVFGSDDFTVSLQRSGGLAEPGKKTGILVNSEGQISIRQGGNLHPKICSDVFPQTERDSIAETIASLPADYRRISRIDYKPCVDAGIVELYVSGAGFTLVLTWNCVPPGLLDPGVASLAETLAAAEPRYSACSVARKNDGRANFQPAYEGPQ